MKLKINVDETEHYTIIISAMFVVVSGSNPNKKLKFVNFRLMSNYYKIENNVNKTSNEHF